MSDNEIRILGKVNKDLADKIFKQCQSDISNVDVNSDWYFVDYSLKEFKVFTWFTIKSISDNNEYIQLLECFPDARHPWHSIPQGYKSICRFDKSIEMEEIDAWARYKQYITAIEVDIATLRDKKINEIFND